MDVGALLSVAATVARGVFVAVAGVIAVFLVSSLLFVIKQVLLAYRVRGVPHGKLNMLVGSLDEIVRFKQEFYLVLRDIHQRFGRLAYVRFITPSVTTTDPELVSLVMMKENFPKGPAYSAYVEMFGRGLVFINGATWNAHRRLMNTGFLPQALRSFLPVFVRHSTHFVDHIAKAVAAPASNGEVMVSQDLVNCTLDIISNTALRFDLNAIDGENALASKAVLKFMSLIGSEGALVRMVPGGGYIMKAINWWWFRYVDGLLNKALKIGKADPPAVGAQPRDLLDVLIGARDADGRPMSDADIRAELLIFFLAGHETTALTLSWCLHLLSKHPDVQRKLVEEVDRVTGGKPIDQNMLSQFTYMTQVLRETLRLCAPVSAATRTLMRDIEWNGMHLPKGLAIYVAIDAIHHDPEFYPDPEAFKPERMSDEEMAKRPQCTFIPFTIGPRICIGMNFFWMEAKSILATLLQRFTVAPAANFTVEPTCVAGTFKPKHGIKLRFVART